MRVHWLLEPFSPQLLTLFFFFCAETLGGYLPTSIMDALCRHRLTGVKAALENKSST